jgi:hypothetical protein
LRGVKIADIVLATNIAAINPAMAYRTGFLRHNWNHSTMKATNQTRAGVKNVK